MNNYFKVLTFEGRVRCTLMQHLLKAASLTPSLKKSNPLLCEEDYHPILVYVNIIITINVRTGKVLTRL